ncbi:sensor histidine kinase [Arsenicicoccus dermatophilus]|uniref:sensor histidine kinase n=1 Tax=Arsenicicoccus dermatophilus TaxID=1076331 RepID=UPI001F4CC57E|nr:HAMP domain-containing histidine kinase [Arsenicicoccus dermatophilus]
MIAPPAAWGGAARRALQRVPLTHRLVLITVMMMAGALTLTTAASSWLLERQLVARLDQELATSAVPLRDAAIDALLRDRELDNFPTNYGVYIYLRGSNQQIAFHPPTETERPDIPPLTLNSPQVTGRTIFEVPSKDGGSKHWHVIAGTLTGGSGTYAVAASLRGVERTTSQAVLFNLGVGLVALTALIGLGWLVIRRAFRPLRQIEDTAAVIAGGDLTRRVPIRDSRDEVASLGLSINRMLSHIEESFQHVEASEARMRQFVADASHELRTPLAAVRGYAELYRQGAVTQPDHVRQVFTRVEDEATRMGALVEDLLALARLDEQRPMTMTDVDLTVLAADAVQDARALAPDRAITLQGIGGPLGPVPVCGDEAKLRQLITNLVGNAVNHTPAGTPVEIAVGAHDPEHALLQVIDHGDGIAPELVERVFERFFRDDPSRGRTEHAGGTGLGLAIVRAIVGAHGGRVWIDQTPDGGATFSVRLPATKPTAQA